MSKHSLFLHHAIHEKGEASFGCVQKLAFEAGFKFHPRPRLDMKIFWAVTKGLTQHGYWICSGYHIVRSPTYQWLYRKGKSGLYMVKKIVFLLLLHWTTWPSLGPAQQDLQIFISSDVNVRKDTSKSRFGLCSMNGWKFEVCIGTLVYSLSNNHCTPFWIEEISATKRGRHCRTACPFSRISTSP